MTKIVQLKERHQALTNESRQILFRKPTENDGSDIFHLVKASKVLDVNSSYSYLMWGKFFSETSIVAELDGQIVGFISGFLQPKAPDTLFIWQVVVDKSQRGKGLATTLLQNLLKQLKHKNVRYLEATVTPSNIPSNNLFKRLAKKLGANYELKECFSEDQFPDPSHEAEMAYRIGPIKK